jgi:hypothetical protein
MMTAMTPMISAPMAIWNTHGVTVLLGVTENSGVTCTCAAAGTDIARTARRVTRRAIDSDALITRCRTARILTAAPRRPAGQAATPGRPLAFLEAL